MRQLLQQRCLPAIAHLRAGLHAPLLMLMLLFPILAPAWPGEALASAAPTSTAPAPAGGEETPAGGSTEQDVHAKPRRLASLQEARTASRRSAPPSPAAPAAAPAIAAGACAPAMPQTEDGARPPGWRLQRGQAPPPA